jgi:uncharacterized protein
MSGKIVDQLRVAAEDVFRRHPVALAYLHGSQASGRATPLSDVDFAVVTTQRLPPRERLRLELDLETELASRLQCQADVRIINTAPLPVQGKILGEGVLLFARDEAFRVNFEATVRARYFDFLPVVKYHRRAYFEAQRASLKKRDLL